MANYRRAQDNYAVLHKQVIELENGHKVFSLVSPPIGSPVARRRIKLIMEDNIQPEREDESCASNMYEKRTPHVITIAVNYDCQCSCKHCSAAPYQEDVRKNKNALSLEELKDAVKQTVDLGTTCVVFTGGEPLLFDGIYDLVRAVDKKRSVCTIFSNGEFLTEKTVAELKKAGLLGIYVSLDHSDFDIHDTNRGRPGLAEKAIQGIKLCQKAGIATGISTFATREKLASGEMDDMMELAKSLNVLEVFIFDVVPTGRLLNQHECTLSDEEVEQLRELREKYNEKADYPRIVHQTMFSSIAYPCAAEGCPAAMVQMHMRANGDVAPCDFTPFSFGNIRELPLSEIWNRMTTSELYKGPSPRCRLSKREFWDKLAEYEIE
ncbi:MAG TPA: radical SAM protein [Geobacteraceae bacterium]|nr:radical SAM protein [Geobacteraceae bacterium]